MALEIYMTATPNGLVPSDACQGEHYRESLKLGNQYKTTVTKSRNILFHRKYFAMLKETFAMQDQFTNPEAWRAAVTVAAGHCDFVPGMDGQLVALPKSVSFASCDEVEFNRVYQDSINAICEHYVPHVDSNEMNRLLEFI